MMNAVCQMFPSRSRRRAAWPCALALALLVLVGCGGSGSSGFDAVALENDAIDRALETSECQVNEGLRICVAGGTPLVPTPTGTPADTPTRRRTAPPTTSPAHGTPTSTPDFGTTGTPTSTPDVSTTATPGPSDHSPTPPATTATPTATISDIPINPSSTPTLTPTPTALPSEPHIATNLDDESGLPCAAAPSPEQPSCSFVFEFAPHGFPPGSTFRVAVRTVEPPTEWVILGEPTNVGTEDAPYYVQDLEFRTSDPNRIYQVAVLTYLAPPSAVAEAVDRLAESDADFAFVTPSLSAAELAGDTASRPAPGS
jgi:hypothetical protein